MAAFPKHIPPRHTNSAQLQAAYGVYMDKEAYEGDEYQTKGSCRSCVPRPKFRAGNSTVRRALAAIEECKSLLPGNQIMKGIILNSFS
jgi:hypothetical protein